MNFPTLHSVRQGSGTTVQLRWQDHISILHLFAWLMLGAMCHNAIDMVAVEMKIDGSVSGQCKLLGSLSTHHEQVTEGIVRLLLGALGDVSLATESVSYINADTCTEFNLILRYAKRKTCGFLVKVVIYPL